MLDEKGVYKWGTKMIKVLYEFSDEVRQSTLPELKTKSLFYSINRDKKAHLIHWKDGDKRGMRYRIEDWLKTMKCSKHAPKLKEDNYLSSYRWL